MANFDKIVEEKDLTLFLSNFQESLNKMNVIKFSDSYIEFPEIIIFSNKNETLRQFLNPGIDILSVDKDDLNSMILDIKSNENFIFIEGALKPKGTLAFNLEKIKNELVLYKESKYFVILNNMLFTIDSLEFHGSFFGGKNNLFLVSKTDLTKIKDYFKKVVN